jgi:hypothetical protein
MVDGGVKAMDHSKMNKKRLEKAQDRIRKVLNEEFGPDPDREGGVFLECPRCGAVHGYTEELSGAGSESYTCKCGMGALIQWIEEEQEIS